MTVLGVSLFGDGDVTSSVSSHWLFMIAFGLLGALRDVSGAILSGLGVVKSRSAVAPSVTVAPDRAIAAMTVIVYELASTRTSSRLTLTPAGVSAIAVIASVFTVLLSDPFVIFRTILSVSIASEKTSSIFLLSMAFTDVIVSSEFSAAERGSELIETISSAIIDEKKRDILEELRKIDTLHASDNKKML
jgi:hypothetical protein